MTAERIELLPLWSLWWVGVFSLVMSSAGHARSAVPRFEERHGAHTVAASAWQLKEQFVLTQPVEVTSLPPSQAETLHADASPTAGVYESDGILPHPPASCHHEAWQAQQERHCVRQWEQGQLQHSHGQVVRQHQALTVKRTAAGATELREWTSCVPHGECDFESFTYLGLLGNTPYHAVELSYGHDAPSLVLVNATSGKLFSVHYGSEPTFLNAKRTLVVNTEDLNPPRSVIVTALQPEEPVIELQCRGEPSSSQQLTVHFHRWLSDEAFVLVLEQPATKQDGSKSSTAATPLLFERTAEGTWHEYTPEGAPLPQLTCRQRNTAQH